MRHVHWEYLGFLLVAIGSSLSMVGAATFYHFNLGTRPSSEYAQTSIPLLAAGIVLAALGVMALIRARVLRKTLYQHELTPMPPPPPPPPPPP